MKLLKDKAEEKLRNLSFFKGLSETDTEIAVDFFIRKLTHKEICLKYNIEYQTSCNKKLRLKKKLKQKYFLQQIE